MSMLYIISIIIITWNINITTKKMVYVAIVIFVYNVIYNMGATKYNMAFLHEPLLHLSYNNLYKMTFF